MYPDSNIVILPTMETTEQTDKRTYTVPEIAALLRISKSKAYALCKQDYFRAINIGRSVRISKESFDKWFDSK